MLGWIFWKTRNKKIVPNFDAGRDKNLRIRLQKIKELEGCLVMHLKGYFDLTTSNNFQRQVARAIEAGFIKLIIHLRQYDMDAALRSSGSEAVDVFIGTITAFLKAVKPRGGDVVLLKIQPKVQEILQLLEFSQFLNIRKNVGEAVTFFVRKEQKVTFPRIFECPICNKKLEASTVGRLLCSNCETMLSIDNAGQVFLA